MLGPIVQVIATIYFGPLCGALIGATINGWKGAAVGFAGGLGMGIGGAIGGTTASAFAGYGFASGFSGSLLNGGSIGDALKAGVIGGAQAYIAAQIGGHFDKGAGFWNEVGRATAHGALGGAVEEARGGQFRHGFYAGFVGSAAGSIVASGPLGKIGGPGGIALRTAIVAVAGGTAAELGGGKFANGALTAAFQHLFNHESGRIGALLKQRQQLLNDIGELDADIAMGEYVSLSHKLATDIVEWVGIGKAVSGGLKLGKGVWGLLSKVSFGGYNSPAQKMINASLVQEAGGKVLTHFVKDGVEDAGQGALLWGLSKAGDSFSDAMNHGEGTLKQAYFLRQQLELQYEVLNSQIQAEIFNRGLLRAVNGGK